jgi:dephospho-CoA kinase
MELIIKYNPEQILVNFEIINDGISGNISDNEKLKDYENNPSVFNLANCSNDILEYIEENFDGVDDATIVVKIPESTHKKRTAEFDRFQDAVKKFNNQSKLQIRVKVDFTQVEIVTSVTLDSEYSHDIENSAVHNNINVKKIAVIGKLASGKTTLITELLKYNSIVFETYDRIDTIEYTDRKGTIYCYEIKGIDFGREHIDKSIAVTEDLIKSGVKFVIYCINGRYGKIEDIERDIIVSLKNKYPEITILVVVTNAINTSSTDILTHLINQNTKKTTCIPVLAEEMRTKAGYLEAYGLDELTRHIWG